MLISADGRLSTPKPPVEAMQSGRSAQHGGWCCVASGPPIKVPLLTWVRLLVGETGRHFRTAVQLREGATQCPDT